MGGLFDSGTIDERASGGLLTIDLGALQHNYRILCAEAKSAAVSAVVKADGYGIGADKAAPALYEAGCRIFFVAQLVEAFRLRPFLPDDATIAILNDIQPGMEAATADTGFLPVLNSLASANAWLALCKSRNKKLPAMLQLDTGMSRLGLSMAEITELAAHPDLFTHADIRFILSHLARSDSNRSKMNVQQLESFRQQIAALPARPLALANSGGIYLGTSYHFDLVRPGLALYGVDPHGRQSSRLRPVIRLEAYVIQTRHVPAKTKIGYGGTFTTTRPTWVTTIAVGYADGWLRCLGNRGSAWYAGERLPIIGRVSMDSITLDTTAFAAKPLQRGALVELIGPNQTLDDVARDAQTIPYEILTALGHRYNRRYINPT